MKQRDQKPKKSPHCECCARCCARCLLVTFLGFVLVFPALVTAFPWLVMQCEFRARNTPPVVEGFVPSRVSFSSCMSNWMDHELMPMIVSDVHIFLGDSIYGDDYSYMFKEYYPRAYGVLRPPVHVAPYYSMLYRKLSCRGSFQSLMARTSYALSTWDDHDYGVDDEGSSNPIKEETRLLFADFWGLNAERRRKAAGVWGSYTFAADVDAGRARSVVVVLPDLHWDASSDMLVSRRQRDWLESCLQSHATSKIILALSTPFTAINASHPDFAGRILAMLGGKQAVIVSGDPHTPAVTRLSETLVDITSSPLAQVGVSSVAEGRVCEGSCTIKNNQDNFGLLDLVNDRGYVMGKNGILLETAIFSARPS